MAVLVVGATGKTGRYVTQALDARGVPVRAASRTPGDPAGAVEPVRFDWTDRETWKEAAEGADAAYLIGPAGAAGAEKLVGEFLSAAPQLERVVLLSAFTAERPPSGIPVGDWEQDVRRYAGQWTILRPNWFHQDFGEQMFLPALAERGELLAPAGPSTVSFVDCRDVAAVAATALTEAGHDGRVYDLTGPEALSFGEAAALIERASGRPVSHRDISDAEMGRYLEQIGLPPPAINWVIGLFGLARQGLASRVTDTVQRVTGQPARPLAPYIGEAAGAWRA